MPLEWPTKALKKHRKNWRSEAIPTTALLRSFGLPRGHGEICCHSTFSEKPTVNSYNDDNNNSNNIFLINQVNIFDKFWFIKKLRFLKRTFKYPSSNLFTWQAKHLTSRFLQDDIVHPIFNNMEVFTLGFEFRVTLLIDMRCFMTYHLLITI